MSKDKKDLIQKFTELSDGLRAFVTRFSADESPEQKAEREKVEAEKLKAESKTAGFKSEKFAEAKLKDGRMVSYDGETPATGMLINVSDEAGNYTPAPDGEYEMEDGSILSVKDGMIVDIKAGGEDEQEMSSIDKKIASLEIDKKIGSLKDEIASLKEQRSSMAKEIGDFKKQIADLSKYTKELFELTEAIADLPADESATGKKPDGFKKTTPEGHGSLEAYFAKMKKFKQQLQN